MIFPHPDTKYPTSLEPRVIFLKNVITRPNIIVGDYSYYFDGDRIEDFESNVLYHYEVLGDKLIIGKFCQIAHGVKFIMNGAIHKFDGITSYPFGVFDGANHIDSEPSPKGDTIIGNDVWIGYEATIMPGVKIGDGAIIGAKALVNKDVEPYSIVGGVPAKLIRKRFADETIQFLLELKWWDQDIKTIMEWAPYLVKGDLESLIKVLEKAKK
jgi:virginiamycin A acetyltransferase